MYFINQDVFPFSLFGMIMCLTQSLVVVLLALVAIYQTKMSFTMSFAPKDEHEAQMQFALEQEIHATLSVIGIQGWHF